MVPRWYCLRDRESFPNRCAHSHSQGIARHGHLKCARAIGNSHCARVEIACDAQQVFVVSRNTVAGQATRDLGS
jgi:hypothetical protein